MRLLFFVPPKQDEEVAAALRALGNPELEEVQRILHPTELAGLVFSTAGQRDVSLHIVAEKAMAAVLCPTRFERMMAVFTGAPRVGGARTTGCGGAQGPSSGVAGGAICTGPVASGCGVGACLSRQPAAGRVAGETGSAAGMSRLPCLCLSTRADNVVEARSCFQAGAAGPVDRSRFRTTRNPNPCFGPLPGQKPFFRLSVAWRHGLRVRRVAACPAEAAPQWLELYRCSALSATCLFVAVTCRPRWRRTRLGGTGTWSLGPPGRACTRASRTPPSA